MSERPSRLAQARGWLDSWPHVAAMLGAGGLVVLGLAVIPTDRLEKLGLALEHLGGVLVHDSASIAGAVGVLTGAGIAAWSAWSAAKKRARAAGAAEERATSVPPEGER